MNHLNWRRREEHPEWFETDETMLVAAYPKPDEVEFAVVSHCQAGYIGLSLDGSASLWTGDWEDVVYWLPIAELEATLPKPTEETP